MFLSGTFAARVAFPVKCGEIGSLGARLVRGVLRGSGHKANF